jgi:hypothetical protein
MKALSALLMVTLCAAAAADPAPTRPPLDLRIRDVREYMTPEEFRANVQGTREQERNTVVVEGKAPLLPMKSERPVPVAILAPFWALANPTQAWRILVPDLKRPPPGKPDPVPPPVFRWGP